MYEIELAIAIDLQALCLAYLFSGLKGNIERQWEIIDECGIRTSSLGLRSSSLGLREDEVLSFNVV